MKKIINIVTLLLLTLSLILPINAVNAQGDLERILENGELRVGTTADFPPFEWIVLEEGEEKIIGADIELAQIVADELGVELVIENMSFDGLIPSLKSGRIDMIIAGMGYTAERAEEVDFSVPYFVSTNYFVVRQDNIDQFQSLEDFTSKRLGAQRASIQEGIIQDQLQEAELTSMPKNGDLIQSLLTNRLDGVLLDSTVGQQFILQNPDQLILLEEFAFGYEDQAGQSIVINKDNPEFLEQINEIVNELVESGQFDEIIAEYLEKI